MTTPNTNPAGASAEVGGAAVAAAPRHTPGPLNVIESKTYTHVETDEGHTEGQGRHVATLPKNARGLADAVLFAAAPNLLAALQALAARVDAQPWGSVWPGRPHAEMDVARAAIAKATGAA